MKMFMSMQETKQERKHSAKVRQLERAERRLAKYMCIDVFDDIDMHKYMDIEPFLYAL